MFLALNLGQIKAVNGNGRLVHKYITAQVKIALYDTQ